MLHQTILLIEICVLLIGTVSGTPVQGNLHPYLAQTPLRSGKTIPLMGEGMLHRTTFQIGKAAAAQSTPGHPDR